MVRRNYGMPPLGLKRVGHCGMSTAWTFLPLEKMKDNSCWQEIPQFFFGVVIDGNPFQLVNLHIAIFSYQQTDWRSIVIYLVRIEHPITSCSSIHMQIFCYYFMLWISRSIVQWIIICVIYKSWFLVSIWVEVRRSSELISRLSIYGSWLGEYGVSRIFEGLLFKYFCVWSFWFGSSLCCGWLLRMFIQCYEWFELVVCEYFLFYWGWLEVIEFLMVNIYKWLIISFWCVFDVIWCMLHISEGQ